jgi:hypothetical protein
MPPRVGDMESCFGAGRLYRKLNSLGHNLPCSIALALLKFQLHSAVGGCLICLALKLD